MSNPSRFFNAQLIHYFRKTINYNDTAIGTAVEVGTFPAGAVLLCGGSAYTAGTTPAVAVPSMSSVIFINRTAWDGSAAVTAGTNGSSYNDLFASADITEGTKGIYAADGATVWNSNGTAGAGFVILNATADTTVYAKSTGSGATTGKGTFVVPFAVDNDG